MREYLLAGCRVQVDEEATRAWYARAEEWNCDCGHCRNFLALARGRELPAELLDILDGLTIPPEKATYVCELYHEGSMLHYQVGYRLSGYLLDRPGCPRPEPWGLEGCTQERFAPFEAPGFPAPSFELDLSLRLPWMLDEPIEGVPAEG